MDSRNQDSLRTRVAIDGHDFYLPSTADLTDVMSRIQNIARTQPGFLTLATTNGIASVLINAVTRVVIQREPTYAPSDAIEPFQAYDPEWDL
ncbi:hypothetical protein D8M34_05780 [Microbacterium sp. HSID17254]|uniref:hypothetical protein n=1 Tax=Microbacterium sp. HSID17254 TaxID=2419509 RepID=UPI000F85E0ED|nr:hypothetical protein [Microbacterium sp. HSID17254]RUQ06978.1 hypothetical protein D8M34_05780 [Microbacterium sp. HSID17254]